MNRPNNRGGNNGNGPLAAVERNRGQNTATNLQSPPPRNATNPGIQPLPGTNPSLARTVGTNPSISNSARTNPRIGRIRSDAELTQTNTLSLTPEQMQEMTASLALVKEASKPPGIFSRLKRIFIFGIISYGLYTAAQKGMLTPLIAIVAQNPQVQQVLSKLPTAIRPRTEAANNVSIESENRDPKQVVNNFNAKLTDYANTLDAIVDGEGDPRKLASDGYESGAARAKRLASLPPVGNTFPLSVGNVIQIQSGPNSGVKCKVSAAHGTQMGSIYQLDCENGGVTESYYFSRDGLRAN